MDINKRIMELENELAILPQGSINIKKINGKEQPYLQWTENGKSKSKYIKKIEREEIFSGVERRKQLQEELHELKKLEPVDTPVPTKFETSVVISNRLIAMTKGVRNWKERDCFKQLQRYLNNDTTDRFHRPRAFLRTLLSKPHIEPFLQIHFLGHRIKPPFASIFLPEQYYTL